MIRRNFFIVSVFLASLLTFSGVLCGQRVIDLDKLWGDIRVLGIDGDIAADGGDQSGYAVASGDINGDGFMDIIIGARWADPGEPPRSFAGETYVIFGSSSPPSTVDLSTTPADITICGAAEIDLVGYAVSSGDVNGDGYDDLIIGAHRASPGGRTSAGKTYVIFGASFPSPPYTIDLSITSADITVCGAADEDYSGYVVASGDVNGDGFDDLIIGAIYADPGERTNAGGTYVIFGDSYPTPPYTIDLSTDQADITIWGDDAGDDSGWAVASGDVNNDGYDDIIIGARNADPDGRTSAGETYVILGSSFSQLPHTIDLSTKQAEITVYGDEVEDQSGYAVSSEDVNGDGYADIIIGAPLADAAYRSDVGATYVIFGSYLLFPPVTIYLDIHPADFTIYGDNAGDCTGWMVVSGDVNGDGYADLIIGAYQADPPGGSSAGKTYVIFGDDFTSSLVIDLSTESADITVYGDDDGDYSGYAVASGDVNGDGDYDIIIGARHADPGGGTNAGETYVIFGSAFPLPPYTIDLDTQPADISVCGDDADDESGFAVASGDINKDGCADIIIGAPYADPDGRTGAGETYVIFGDDFTSPVVIDLSTDQADITVYGYYADDNSGSAAGSGDVTGDSYDDIIIGARFAYPGARTHSGETYVVFGGNFSSLPYTIDLYSKPADITICGDDAYDRSGNAVASGDINSDGYDDIIIGAYWADPGGRTDAGETYLIAGGGAFITAHGLGGKSWIKEFSLLASDRGSFKAFGAVNSQGEVHLAVGDIDADSLDEIAAGQGEGAKSWVKFFEVDGSLISTFKAFGAANTNGELHLAIGNFDADTADNEIAIAQGEGGQSWVKTFETDGTPITAFKAFGAANAQGEVHLAAGDLENADGIDEIVAGMGEGGSSRVKIFNYDGTVIRSFAAFDSTDNPGGEVRLAVGNFDADADMEIAVATGYNGGNKVRLFDKDGTLIKQFLAFGFGGNTNGDVQIAASDIDNDGIDELICGHGEGGVSQVKVLKPDGSLMLNFKAFGGVNAQGEVHLGKSNY